MFSNISPFQFLLSLFFPFFAPHPVTLTSSRLARDAQVAGSAGNVETSIKQHLERLDEIFATRPDYLQTLRFVQLMVNNVVRELTALPDISEANVDVASIADQTAVVEYYRSERLKRDI